MWFFLPRTKDLSVANSVSCLLTERFIKIDIGCHRKPFFSSPLAITIIYKSAPMWFSFKAFVFIPKIQIQSRLQPQRCSTFIPNLLIRNIDNATLPQKKLHVLFSAILLLQLAFSMPLRKERKESRAAEKQYWYIRTNKRGPTCIALPGAPWLWHIPTSDLFTGAIQNQTHES